MNDWNGAFELVNPAEIIIDHRYQRGERATLIANIASNPAWEAFGMVVCIKRTNGMLYAVDGQQRLRGVLSSTDPPKRVPIIWFPVTSVEEEARIFSVINEARKAVFPLEKHKARLVAKDAASLAIERAVNTAGFTIGDSYDSPRTVKAVGTLNHVYNELGEEGTVLVLTVVREAWGDDKQAVSPAMLRVVCQLISESNGGFNRQRVTAALARTSPSRVLRKAEELTFDMGGGKQANVRRAVKALVKV